MGWDEMFFVGFVWLFLIWEAVRGRDTPPAPLKRGDLDTDFSLIMSCLSGDNSPLGRGLRGVLR